MDTGKWQKAKRPIELILWIALLAIPIFTFGTLYIAWGISGPDPFGVLSALMAPISLIVVVVVSKMQARQLDLQYKESSLSGDSQQKQLEIMQAQLRLELLKVKESAVEHQLAICQQKIEAHEKQEGNNDGMQASASVCIRKRLVELIQERAELEKELKGLCDKIRTFNSKSI